MPVLLGVSGGSGFKGSGGLKGFRRIIGVSGFTVWGIRGFQV